MSYKKDEIVEAINAAYVAALDEYNVANNNEGDVLSKNTRHTKMCTMRKEIRRLIVINALVKCVSSSTIDNLMSDKMFRESLSSIMNPATNNGRIVVNEGDTLLGIIMANPDAKDIVNRATKAADKAGLKLGSDNNTFVKA